MPITGWHAARLQDPARFSAKAWRTTAGGTIYGKKKIPSSINIVWGKLKGKDKPSDPPIAQALRFPTSKYTAASAKAFLKKNKIKYIGFTAAKAGVAGSVQVARSLLIYPKDIPLLTPVEAFFSLRDALEKAVSYKFGADAFVHDFSNKEVIIGYSKSEITPMSSWESGEYDKIVYKLKGSEIVFSGIATKVTKSTSYENLSEKDWEELWQMEGVLLAPAEKARKATKIFRACK